ncbi:acetate kinase [Rhodoligotrophos appendicifer]|uniref:acetate/propionate family kinase n=1 Tax=Rhodoligotrophos appendicifer TaxID=987056 RepID=UPI0011872BC9|nr:acetate/propionate family kinase [Rhodoligotrophos appendicifer]
MTSSGLFAFNAGSSSIKVGIFRVEAALQRVATASIDLRHKPTVLKLTTESTTRDLTLGKDVSDLLPLVEELVGVLCEECGLGDLLGVGHRIVHGGNLFTDATAVNEKSLEMIRSLIPLAPLHQPQGLHLIEAMRSLRPELPQSASFDTVFHRTQDERRRRFALPREFEDQGIKRYGFHGLSYKFIAAALRKRDPAFAAGRVVVAHLGSGASLCGLVNGVSRDTSMSFSTLDGIPMATRPGSLDAGVLLYLLQQRGWSAEALEDLLYHRSGLLGISGVSADTRDLLSSSLPEARQALELFTLATAREAAGIATTMGGLDGIVFTGGIGEHQPQIRAAVCAQLTWLGTRLDARANEEGMFRIDAPASRVALAVLATDEEQVIAEEALDVLG